MAIPLPYKMSKEETEAYIDKEVFKPLAKYLDDLFNGRKPTFKYKVNSTYFKTAKEADAWIEANSDVEHPRHVCNFVTKCSKHVFIGAVVWQKDSWYYPQTFTQKLIKKFKDLFEES